MTQTDLADDEEEYNQDIQDASQSIQSSGSVDDGKEKFKIMIHKILGVADKKQIGKICCFFKINKQWSLTKQLFCAYSLFLSLFMFIILGFFIFYVKFSPNYVGDTILDQIDDSISENFNNSLQEYSKQVNQYFKSYSTWMIMFSELLSNQLGWSTSLFENNMSTYIKSRSQYFQLSEKVPANLINTKYSNKPPFNRPITFETFSYFSQHPDDQTQLSADTKSILDSVDILSYFFKNFILDPNISKIQSLYIFMEDRDTTCFYPGGITSTDEKIILNSKLRPWYINSHKAFNDNGKKLTFTVTGPYQDIISQQKTLTYSLPIINQSNPDEIAALVNVDILINNFKSVYDLLQQKDGVSRIALIDYTTELIINDCFSSPQIITFYQTEITGFTSANWDEIKDFSTYPQNSTFIIKNYNETKFYIARSLIKDQQNQQNKFILIIFGEESNYLSYRNDTQDQINKQLYNFYISLIITVSVTWFLSYFFIYLISKHTVQPLAKLSNLAKSINRNDERKNTTEDIKEQLSKIKGADSNTKKLIYSFINLVDQHSGMRKLANGNQENYIPLYNRQNINPEHYPRNDYKGDIDDIKEQFRYLNNINKHPLDDDEEDEEEDNEENNQDINEYNYNIDEYTQDINHQNQDIVRGANPKCQSSSSENSNKEANKDDNTEVDELCKDNKNTKCIQNNKHIQGNTGQCYSPQNQVALNRAAIEPKVQKKKYFSLLKEKLDLIKDSEAEKLSLSLQLLSSFLPQNTQSI